MKGIHVIFYALINHEILTSQRKKNCSFFFKITINIIGNDPFIKLSCFENFVLFPIIFSQKFDPFFQRNLLKIYEFIF